MSEKSYTVYVDTQQVVEQIKPYWKKCVGSGHAALGLRRDWQLQLEQVHKELGFEQVRFHGLLNDDMNVCAFYEGKTHYSFVNIDILYDALLDIGIKPFVELSFMPRCLASDTKTVFHYQGNITPPQQMKEWGELIRALTEHLVRRYGLAEVKQWFFEVWNEPNLDAFWSGNQSQYFELYRHAAEAIKSVHKDLQVGGPSTAQNAWIPEMIEFCQNNQVPLDFVSTHHYPTDSALGMSEDMQEQMSLAPRGVVCQMVQKARQEARNYPLFYTEWNNSPSCRDWYHDTSYAAAFIVKSIVDNQKYVDMYSFWTFSDIFEEVPMPSHAFYGGFGLMTICGIPKPSYRAFELLGLLGSDRLNCRWSDVSPTSEMIATRTSQNELVCLLYNHHVPKAPIETECIRLEFSGLSASTTHVRITKIDEDHANPRSVWVNMGSPDTPSQEQIQALRQASELVWESVPLADDHQGRRFIEVNLPPHAVYAIVI